MRENIGLPHGVPVATVRQIPSSHPPSGCWIRSSSPLWRWVHPDIYAGDGYGVECVFRRGGGGLAHTYSEKLSIRWDQFVAKCRGHRGGPGGDAKLDEDVRDMLL